MGSELPERQGSKHTTKRECSREWPQRSDGIERDHEKNECLCLAGIVCIVCICVYVYNVYRWKSERVKEWVWEWKNETRRKIRSWGRRGAGAVGRRVREFRIVDEVLNLDVCYTLNHSNHSRLWSLSLSSFSFSGSLILIKIFAQITILIDFSRKFALALFFISKIFCFLTSKFYLLKILFFLRVSV